MSDGKSPRRRKRKKARRPSAAGSVVPVVPLSSFALVPAALQLKHSDRTKQRAIDAFLEHGTVAAACAASGVGRATWYDWRQADPEFKRLVDEADEHVTDQLEQVAKSRATMAEGSDTLLIFLLKARRRGKYGDRDIIRVLDAEVKMRLEGQFRLIASRETWDAAELFKLSLELWK